MSAFEQHIKNLVTELSPAAREVTKFVIEAEHRRRFAEDRSELREEFAHQALSATKPTGSDQ
ncbi:hypothetical protein F4553_005285 [Allocatelliglobosispora scoriae]|uniref:Uncharacterized protein n=1 Tax=Allocatelliglobosispora scoriae TaxID=643052 RepID=A0A841BWL9_9ACTN|nr:hypothetical protein [Allocatelliglobosispora scoriae]MBB5871906.1 hypothetical protein [Allocatelliglobosispora scoriae]